MKKQRIHILIFSLIILMSTPLLADPEDRYPLTSWKGPVIDTSLTLEYNLLPDIPEEAVPYKLLMKKNDTSASIVEHTLSMKRFDLIPGAFDITETLPKTHTPFGVRVYPEIFTHRETGEEQVVNVEQVGIFGEPILSNLGPQPPDTLPFASFGFTSQNHVVRFYGFIYTVENQFLMKGHYLIVRTKMITGEIKGNRFVEVVTDGTRPLIEKGAFVLVSQSQRESISDSQLQFSDEEAEEESITPKPLYNKKWGLDSGAMEDRLGNVIGEWREQKPHVTIYDPDGTLTMIATDPRVPDEFKTLVGTYELEGRHLTIRPPIGEPGHYRIIYLDNDLLMLEDLGFRVGEYQFRRILTYSPRQ